MLAPKRTATSLRSPVPALLGAIFFRLQGLGIQGFSYKHGPLLWAACTLVGSLLWASFGMWYVTEGPILRACRKTVLPYRCCSPRPELEDAVNSGVCRCKLHTTTIP